MKNLVHPQQSQADKTEKTASKITPDGPTTQPLELRQAIEQPRTARPETLLRLQRSYGNRAVRSTIMRSEAEQTVVQRNWLDSISSAVSSAADTAGGWIEDVDTQSRSLSEEEISLAQDVFGDTIDYSQVVLERNSLYNIKSSRTFGNTIALVDSKFEGDGLELNSFGWKTLIHELGHVWQYQNQSWLYFPHALWAQTEAWWETDYSENAYDWRSLDSQGLAWEEWNPEAQAEAAEDYANALRRVREGYAEPADYVMLVRSEPYVDKMRQSPPDSKGWVMQVTELREAYQTLLKDSTEKTIEQAKNRYYQGELEGVDHFSHNHVAEQITLTIEGDYAWHESEDIAGVLSIELYNRSGGWQTPSWVIDQKLCKFFAALKEGNFLHKTCESTPTDLTGSWAEPDHIASYPISERDYVTVDPVPYIGTEPFDFER